MDIKVGIFALELGIDALSSLLLPDLLHRLGNHAQSARFAVNVARVCIASRFDFYAELHSRGFSLVLPGSGQPDTVIICVAFTSSVCTSV